MKRILVGLAVVVSSAAILLALDLGGLAFTQVDVEGHQVRMLISGQGTPTVVFEAGGSPGAGGPLEAWERVQPAVSQLTRTVSYDRAGIGLSAPGPTPRDARQVARELHIALRNAHVPPPYLLVGHSFGGPLNRVFAGLYRDEIAGMVLLDPTQEEFIEWNKTRGGGQEKRQDQEWKDIQASLAEAHESQLPPGIPVVVITAMGPRVFPGFVTEAQKQERKLLQPMWLKFHDEWVKTIPNGRHVITENSGHGIPFEEPALVIKTIREVVNRTRLADASPEGSTRAD